METLGYYLYMSKQEEKQKQQEVNVENYFDLVGVEATTNQEEEENSDFSCKQSPLYTFRSSLNNFIVLEDYTAPCNHKNISDRSGFLLMRPRTLNNTR